MRLYGLLPCCAMKDEHPPASFINEEDTDTEPAAPHPHDGALGAPRSLRSNDCARSHTDAPIPPPASAPLPPAFTDAAELTMFYKACR